MHHLRLVQKFQNFEIFTPPYAHGILSTIIGLLAPGKNRKKNLKKGKFYWKIKIAFFYHDNPACVLFSCVRVRTLCALSEASLQERVTSTKASV